MASLKKKAINASTKLQHSLKKVLISLVEREGEVSEERRGEESAKDVSSDSREGALVLKALGFNITRPQEIQGATGVASQQACGISLSEALASSAFSEGRTYNSSNRRPGVRHSTFESLRLGLNSQSIASGFFHFWDSLNFKKDREFVGITVFFLDEKLQARLQSGKFKWNDIPTTKTASVMDSYLPRIALTMVYGKKKILLLKKDRDNPVNSPFQAEQQMEANFSGSSSTSRKNQKIYVGGRLIKGILQRSEMA
ncbi:unnamed protein product [Brassica oleracea]